MNRFWNFTNVTNEDGTETRALRLEGAIAEESWFGDEVTPNAFRDELNDGSGDIDVYINSPGGDCIAASQIYTMLKEYDGNVTVKIEGIAASAASVVSMAGDTVMMAPTAIMMIHNPMTCAAGNREDMRKAIKLLDEVKESIVNAYEAKTGLDRAEIARLMDNETWMNANRALELGFIDSVMFTEADDACKKELKNSFQFSQHTIDMKVANMMMEIGDDAEEPPVNEMLAEDSAEKAQVGEDKEAITDGTSVETLYERLNGKKYF